MLNLNKLASSLNKPGIFLNKQAARLTVRAGNLVVLKAEPTHDSSKTKTKTSLLAVPSLPWAAMTTFALGSHTSLTPLQIPDLVTTSSEVVQIDPSLFVASQAFKCEIFA